LNHLFPFEPGEWIGHGTLILGMGHQALRFRMRWQIQSPQQHTITACQEIDVQGLTNPLVNRLELRPTANGHFKVDLSNAVIGALHGRGLIDGEVIAWELSDTERPRGFEIYERMTSDRYQLHAEYASDEFHRTIIDGELWKFHPKEG
jgi:hypothetical protein